MAPEVALNKYYSERADVYSYGMILWQMFADDLPFRALTREQFLVNVVKGGERPVLDPEWPADLCDIISSCWQVRQDGRPSFGTIVRRLECLLEDLESGNLDVSV